MGMELHVLFIIFQTHFSLYKDSFLGGSAVPRLYLGFGNLCGELLLELRARRFRSAPITSCLGFPLPMGRREGIPLSCSIVNQLASKPEDVLPEASVV